MKIEENKSHDVDLVKINSVQKINGFTTIEMKIYEKSELVDEWRIY